MAACRLVAILGINSSESFFALFRSLDSSLTSCSIGNGFGCRRISQLVKPNGKRAIIVDTLALARRLEAQGVPLNQAGAITAAISEVLNDSLENVVHSIVSNAEMQKSKMIQESNLSKFKSEVQSSQVEKMEGNSHCRLVLVAFIKSYWKEEEDSKVLFFGEVTQEQLRDAISHSEHHFSMLQRETEKRTSDIEKMRSELRYEIVKVTAGQRLDLNLERGRIRDELARMRLPTKMQKPPTSLKNLIEKFMD